MTALPLPCASTLGAGVSERDAQRRAVASVLLWHQLLFVLCRSFVQPILTSPSVDWGALSAFLVHPVAPARLKPLYPGSRCTMYGVLRGTADLPDSAVVTVTANGPDGPLR